MPETTNNLNLNKPPPGWYLTPWGMILIIFSLFFLIFLVYFGTLVYNEYQLVKNGNNVNNVKAVGLENYLTNQSKFNENDPRLSFSDDPYLGNLNARVKIIEFGDFQCPYCRESFPIIRSLAEQYGDQILIVYRDFPLTTTHPQAKAAALAAGCAQAQGKFWEYHDKLFINQENLAIADLLNYAQQINLNIIQFQGCLTTQQQATEVEQDISDGTDLGVKGTPTFFINGIRIAGSIPEDIFKEIINYLLKTNN